MNAPGGPSKQEYQNQEKQVALLERWLHAPEADEENAGGGGGTSAGAGHSLGTLPERRSPSGAPRREQGKCRGRRWHARGETIGTAAEGGEAVARRQQDRVALGTEVHLQRAMCSCIYA